MTRERSGWEEITAADPTHSQRYAERFRTMAREGRDLDGEARLVDAMAPRGARILDAGCGPGRVGAALAARGHTVVGVDVDPVLVRAANSDHPGPMWLVGDLAELDLPARGIPDPFDLALCGGNVMTFLAPSTRVEVLRRIGEHLVPLGRLVVGFGTGRGYEASAFRMDARVAGLRESLLLSSWDLRPWTPSSDFLVAVLERR